MQKICNICKKEKPIEDFRFKNKLKNKRHWACKTCLKDYYKQRYQNDPTYKANILLGLAKRRKKHKNHILSVLDNVCEICSRDMPVYIDHDHKTGLVRGALCVACNAGLGHFQDDIPRLKKAIKYLKKGLLPFKYHY